MIQILDNFSVVGLCLMMAHVKLKSEDKMRIQTLCERVWGQKR